MVKTSIPARTKPNKRMQAAARMASFDALTLPARRRLIRVVSVVKHMRTTILLSLLLTAALFAEEPAGADAQALIEQMRGHSMQSTATVRSDGTVILEEKHRQEIIDQLRAMGPKSISSVVAALSDSDVQMRRNAELVLIWLAGAYDGKPKMDIREAIPALIHATQDKDADVRAWAAHALAEIGPAAKTAIPSLLILIKDDQEGPRNTSCLALGNIGPAAKSALPALHRALSDPSQDVRRFAQRAIEQINTEKDAAVKP